MPDGTIQDSRNPYSPQWGYLKVRNPNDISRSEPKQLVGDWNEYVLFIDPNATTRKQAIKNYKRNVDFKMVKATITIEITGKETGWTRQELAQIGDPKNVKIALVSKCE